MVGRMDATSSHRHSPTAGASVGLDAGLRSIDFPPEAMLRPSQLRDGYRHKSVLIVGGSGFLGFNLARVLSACDANVTVGARGMTTPAAAYPAGVRQVRLDVTEPHTLVRAVDDCEMLFVVAGATGAVRSLEQPLDDLRSNLIGQLNLLEVVRRSRSQPRVVLASSRLVYGPSRYLPVDEDHATEPTSTYAVHKLTAEKYHLLYHKAYGLRTSIARITVAFGPHAAPNGMSQGVVTTFVRNVTSGVPITMYSTGTQTRDFVYVDDVVDALLRIGASDQTIGRTLNVGGGSPVTLSQLAETLVRVAGQGEVSYIPWPKDAATVETGDFYADISLIRRMTGWQPRTSLEEGLRRCVDDARGIEHLVLSAARTRAESKDLAEASVNDK